jgi:O-antigen/teichoic acid export membrane protein
LTTAHGSEARGLVRDASVLAVGTLLGKALLQGFNVVSARTLEVDGFGIVVLSLTVLAFAVDLTTPLNSNVIIRYGRAGQLGPLVSAALRAGLLLSGAVAAGLLVFPGILADRIFAGDDLVVRFAALAVPAVVLHRILGAALVVDGRVRHRALYIDVLYPLLMLTSVTALVVIGSVSPVAVVGATTVAAILVGLIAFARGGWFERPMRVGRRAWRYAGVVYATSNLGSATRHLDVLLLGLLLDPVAVGLYGAASQFTLALEIWTRSLVSSFGPRVAKHLDTGDTAAVVGVYRAASRIGVAAIAPFVVAGTVAATDVLGLVFGNDYRPAGVVLAVLLLGAVVRAATIGASTLLTVGDREGTELRISAVGAVVTAAGTLALVPFFGLLGAAGAKVAALLLLQVFRFRAIRQILGQRLGVSHVTGPLAAMVLGTAAGLAVRLPLGAGWWVAAVVLSQLVLAVGLLGALSRSERRQVLAMFRLSRKQVPR